MVTAQAITQSTQSTTNVAGAIFASTGSSVVEITTGGQIGRGQFAQTGSGSGFVIDASGLIVTNAHVVENASTVTITFSTGDERTTTVAGTDSTHDLALLDVSDMPDGIPAVTLGDSDAVAVGDTAMRSAVSLAWNKR
jgi:S1-C subfamily serine protease